MRIYSKCHSMTFQYKNILRCRAVVISVYLSQIRAQRGERSKEFGDNKGLEEVTMTLLAF